ncbi:MAG: hypothetical protein KKB25_00320 [Nanoarchaeota archaeon]|nr:hypothetical protein [Nanoarchaeota archaeon]
MAYKKISKKENAGIRKSRRELRDMIDSESFIRYPVDAEAFLIGSYMKVKKTDYITDEEMHNLLVAGTKYGLPLSLKIVEKAGEKIIKFPDMYGPRNHLDIDRYIGRLDKNTYKINWRKIKELEKFIKKNGLPTENFIKFLNENFGTDFKNLPFMSFDYDYPPYIQANLDYIKSVEKIKR